MNPNRKLLNFHINVPGHRFLDVPHFKELFYCYEVESIEHTHVGMVLHEPMSKNQMIRFIVDHNEGLEDHQVQVVSHTNWGTIWGYHCGFGDKESCSSMVWISKTVDEAKTMILNRRMHKKITTCNEQKEKTFELLNKKPVECLRDGMVSLKGYCGFKRDHEEAMQDIKASMEEEIEVPLAPKKRHLWFYGPSNTGKSTKAKAMGDYFVVPRNNDWKFYKGQKFILIEEFKGKFWTIDNLQELCDCDNYQVNTKGSSKTLARDCVILITSRYSPEELWKDEDREDLNGILNRFNVEQLTHVYYT